jgi:hypothetical protein
MLLWRPSRLSLAGCSPRSMPVVSALEAVYAKIPPFESCLHSARFDDRGNGPGRNRLAADPGRGRGGARRRRFRRPDAPEHRARPDSGSLQPGRQRTHRARLGVAIGRGTITASVCGPLVWCNVRRSPRSVFSSCSTRIAASSDRSERTAQGYRRFRCRGCGKQLNERSTGSLNRTYYPSDVIALVVLWRLKLGLVICLRCSLSGVSCSVTRQFATGKSSSRRGWPKASGDADAAKQAVAGVSTRPTSRSTRSGVISIVTSIAWVRWST